MALAMAAFMFVGFAPTYFLAAWNDAPTPPLTPPIHLHGALSTAWIVLLATQTGLIAANRYDIHKLTGVIGAVLATAVLATGLYVAINSERRVHTDLNAGTLGDPYVFLIFPVAAIVIFALFVVLGVLNRHHPDMHKRLMLFATMSLLAPALARIVGRTTTLVPPPIGALILMDVFVLLLIVYDFASRGRLHPATLWGGGFLLLSEPLRVAIGFSEPWQAFARSLMG
jgi:hypothetical protein